MHVRLPLHSAPKSVCVLRLSAIGDTCHTLAAARQLQDHWPQTKITWIIGKTEATLLGDIPDIEFIIFDKHGGNAAERAFKKSLDGRSFDILLHMQAAMRASLLSRSIDAPVRLGFDRARAKDFQWLFTTHQIAPMPAVHAMEAQLGFMSALGIPRQALRWDIPIPDDAMKFARRLIPDEMPTLVISPCSSTRARNWRNWSIENYAQLARHAREQWGVRVLLTGGNTELEQHYGAQISALSGAVNLVGQTNLKQLLALIQRAKAVIAPDSGPVHLATTVGTPVVGLYASTNPARTGPALAPQWTVNKYPAALHAEGKRVETAAWGERVRRPDVMDLIGLNDVLEKLEMVMNG